MTVSDQQLIDAALMARESAYGAYSGYRVGAALIDEAGLVHVGCNVENESYPLGACAETGAISAMAVSGGRRIRTLVVAGGYNELGTCTPCGACRQRIAEFADDDTRILMLDAAGAWCQHGIDSLLPLSFKLPGHSDG
ncbi:MAG: cytidine deaminase [Pseudomonadota bacterium]